MKTNRKIIICALLVLVMLCVISSASANDSINENLATNATTDEVISIDASADEDVVASDASEVLKEGNTITVSGGGTGKISAAVNGASSGDTIYIENGEYTENAKIDIGTKQLSFIGQSQEGVIITSGDNDLFYTTGSGYSLIVFNCLTFKDISMTGAKVPIFIGGDGNVNITNCVFDNCASRYGALRIFTSGSVTVDQCKFLNTKSSTNSYSSAIDFGGSGNTEYVIKNSIIDNSTIASTNTASYIFGTIYSEKTAGTVILDNVTISNFQGNGKGRALITAKGNMEIKNSRFINNNLYESNQYAGLFFISAGSKTLTIETSLIANNSESNYILSTNSATSSFILNYNNIQNNTFKLGFNHPTSGSYALDSNYWGSNELPYGVTASNWIIENNGVYELNGEPITVIIPGLNDQPVPEFPEGTIYVAENGDDNNDGSEAAPVKTIKKAEQLAGQGSGYIVLTEGTYTENNIALNKNIAYNIIGKGDVTINGNSSSNSIFVMHGGQATFTNIKFTNNNPKYGGAIFVNYGAGAERTPVEVNITVEKCTFEDISSTDRAGAIYLWYTYGNLTVKDSTFKNINSGSYGALTTGFSAYENGLNVIISGTTFENNKANNGAAAYLAAKTVSITDTKFINNTAEYAPAALYLYNSTATVDACEFINNTAKGPGSAIQATMPSSAAQTTLTMTNSIVENNRGSEGTQAAIYADMTKIDISYSSLINDLSVETRTAESYDYTYGQGVLIANNNWWGTNNPSSKVKGKNITIDKWVIMNVEANASKIIKYDVVKLTVDFNHVNTTSGVIEELTGGEIPKKSYTVEFTVPEGTITPSSVEVKKGGSASVEYEVSDVIQIVTATSGEAVANIEFDAGIEPYYGVIYLSADGNDANNGSESAPVATLDKAMALALRAHGTGEIIIAEGTYTSHGYSINKNLTITGIGKVTFNHDANERLFSIPSGSNVDKVELSNLIINGVNQNYGAFIYNYAAKAIILDNITISDNPNTNARLISSNTGSLTVKNSNMSNNNVSGIFVHSGSGNITIINSIFENNRVNYDTSVYALIYFSSGSGEINIENSRFLKNTVRQNVVYSGYNNDIYMKNSEISDTASDVGYGAAIRASAKLIVDNSTFINNKAYRSGGAIDIESNGDATITNSVFINNYAGTSEHGDNIYNKGKLTINYSILLSDGNNKNIYNDGSYKVNAQFNWWGTNDDPKSLNGVGSYYDYDEWDYVNSEEVDASNWIVMTVTSDMTKEFIRPGDNVTITVDFTNYMDSTGKTQKLAQNIHELEVSAKAVNGELDYQTLTTKDNVCQFKFTANETYGKNPVNITSSNAVVPLMIDIRAPYDGIVYVSATDGSDANEGSIDAPVKTLNRAAEIVKSGQIIIYAGNYKTSDLGIISTDLNITGIGKVTIDADNNNRILYSMANVVLKNLILTNGYASESGDESGALLGNSGNLTIINCTLANSRSEKNGGAIYNAGNLYVIDSTFENNTADKCGGAIFTQSAGIGIIPTLTVSNSIFKNNTANGNSKYDGGAVYVQAASSVSIRDSLFEQNKATQYGGGALEIVNTETATVENTTFIKNTAIGEDYKDKSDYGGGAISFIGSYGDLKETLTVTNSLFIDNSVSECGGGAIYARYSKVNIANSVLINNNDANNVSVYRRTTDINTAQITANDNWWGSNDSPKSKINGGTLSRWAILTIANSSQIKEGETVKLTVSINQYTTGSENGTLANPIKVERPVLITTNLGSIEGTLTDGEFTTDYLVPSGLKMIKASVDDETQILYAITTDATINASDITGAMGDRVVYTVNLTTVDGSIINIGNVEVYFDNELVATIPVLNNHAKSTLIINKATGIYSITVKYVDDTKEFVAGDAVKTLNVTGIDNIVTPETIDKFFDNGVLKSDLPFDELIFKGEFNDIGLITIKKSIKLTGDNAVFNNASFSLDADNIVLDNVNIVLDKYFDENNGAAVYIGGDNVTLSNSNITYNAPDNKDSCAVSVDIVSDVKIINNNIRYSAKSEGDKRTIAVNIYGAENLVFENNVVDASIPSVPIGYANWPITEYFSEGVYIAVSDNVSFKNNTIKVRYNNATGSYDTIYAVHFDDCDDSRIADNSIELNGYTLAYGLVANNCDNLSVSANTIQSNSDVYYALGLQIAGDSSAVVDNNNISAKAKDVTYPVYLDDWGNDCEVNLTNNIIKGESDTVYGVYVEENKTAISNNSIDVNGNHVYGIVTHETDAQINNNEINANGKDVGPIVSPQSGVNENTTGIIVSKGSAQIENNNVVTSGKSTITALNTNATVKNNGLTAKNTTADNSITSINSTVISSNNTEVKKAEPAEPVVKITATNNAKVDYGFGYAVRITQDGKSIGAGKVVTLKIAGKTLTAKTNANGYATFNLAVKPKAYTVTVTYNKVTQKYKVTVKSVIKAKNLKVKKSAKKLKVKVTLKTSAKKAIKGKKVILKIKGKKITAKTNKKGVATFNIKKNILKKLKAGKKYKYQVIYGKDTVKKTLKVKK